MALTKSDIPDLLLPGLRAEFALAYKSELDTSVADQITTIVNTTLPIQKYGWLGTVPPMREFVDERRPSGLSAREPGASDELRLGELSIRPNGRLAEAIRAQARARLEPFLKTGAATTGSAAILSSGGGATGAGGLG